MKSKKEQSSYFAAIRKAAVQKFGKAKGQEFAERFWKLRALNSDQAFEELTKMTYQLFG
jgi:hypothetical protein